MERGDLTCKPAFALCDFCGLPVVSLGPALPPVDFPFPPGILIDWLIG